MTLRKTIIHEKKCISSLNILGASVTMFMFTVPYQSDRRLTSRGVDVKATSRDLAMSD